MQHHGGAILKLGGTTGIRSCRAAQAEVVQAQQVPDGLLEVELNDPGIAELFGGRKTMIESPVIQELVAEVEHKTRQNAMHSDISLILESRFVRSLRTWQPRCKVLTTRDACAC